MPTLLNYNGENEFKSNGSHRSNPMLLSIGSHSNVRSSPCKRAHISASMIASRSKYTQSKRPSIEMLPNECLFEILRRVPRHKERSACACVSKKWLNLLSSIRNPELCKIPTSNDTHLVSLEENVNVEGDGYLTRSLEGREATDLRLVAIAVGTRGCGGLGKLLIKGSNPISPVSNIGLSAIAHNCPSLRVLRLWNVNSIGDESLIEIGKECHRLAKLDVSHCPLISDKGLIAIAENCPNLNAVTVKSCRKIGNEGIQAIGKFCPKLRSICIKDCPLVTDHGISSLMLSASTVLSNVELHGLNFSDFSLAVIGHYGKAVTDLVLVNLKKVTGRGFWAMGMAQGLQKLTSLTITSCDGLNTASLESIGKGCTSLKLICLRKCYSLADNDLVAFAKAIISLENLNLEQCHAITHVGVIGVLVNVGEKLKTLTLVKCMGIKDMGTGLQESTMPYSSLECLSIRFCTGTCETSLAMIGKLCPHLQHIDFSGLCRSTDAALLPLINNCEDGLVTVNLSGCFNITDEVILALTRIHGGTLELLFLDGCRKITDASLAAVADNCLVLHELDVSNTSITDSGIGILSSTEHLSLHVLSMAGCSGVTNKCVGSLQKLASTLGGINVQNCTFLSRTNVDLLAAKMWRCEFLS